MDIPYYSQQELWRKLTSDQIGFYTDKTSSKIPEKPGIYAWFLPVDISGELSKAIRKYKEYQGYDSTIKNSYCVRGISEFQWSTLRYDAHITNDYRVQSTLENKWIEMSEELSGKKFKALRQAINLTSIFSKPLYVGLTKNLSGRYEQHLAGTRKNSFYKRFTDFSNEKGLDISIKQLIFCCIPFEHFSSLEEDFMDEDAIQVIEYIVKNISGPIFGEV
ncbi:hypothetical protein [Marinobacter nauticus]|uniref:hypothetical protein n=1 Tax=Marinobacter nauticus TaxID=2743 RepID=UPI001CFDE067|nr:hypothetical protein [Marinobacter nauticus]